jgi:hypothetical protein
MLRLEKVIEGLREGNSGFFLRLHQCRKRKIGPALAAKETFFMERVGTINSEFF